MWSAGTAGCSAACSWTTSSSAWSSWTACSWTTTSSAWSSWTACSWTTTSAAWSSGRRVPDDDLVRVVLCDGVLGGVLLVVLLVVLPVGLCRERATDGFEQTHAGRGVHRTLEGDERTGRQTPSTAPCPPWPCAGCRQGGGGAVSSTAGSGSAGLAGSPASAGFSVRNSCSKGATAGQSSAGMARRAWANRGVSNSRRSAAGSNGLWFRPGVRRDGGLEERPGPGGGRQESVRRDHGRERLGVLVGLGQLGLRRRERQERGERLGVRGLAARGDRSGRYRGPRDVGRRLTGEFLLVAVLVVEPRERLGQVPSRAARAGVARPRVVHQQFLSRVPKGLARAPTHAELSHTRPARAAQTSTEGRQTTANSYSPSERRSSLSRSANSSACSSESRSRARVRARRARTSGSPWPRMSRTAVAGTRGFVAATLVVTVLLRAGAAAAAAALAVSARQISESPSKSLDRQDLAALLAPAPARGHLSPSLVVTSEPGASSTPRLPP